MPQEKRKVNCRFCSWQRPLFWREKATGKTKSGMDALLEHVENEHPDKAHSILQYSCGRPDDSSLGGEDLF